MTGTTERTGRGIGVNSRTATTIATRKVMTRNRTRPNQGSHSTVCDADFISGPLLAPRPPAPVVPGPCPAQTAARAHPAFAGRARTGRSVAGVVGAVVVGQSE